MRSNHTANHPYGPIGSQPLTFLDVETVRDRIVEIAMLRFEAGVAPVIFQSLINPGTLPADAWKWATRVHGISPDDLTRAPAFGDIAPAVVGLCHDATIVAHNASFERRYMTTELGRLGIRWERPHLCTLRLAREQLPGGAYNLQALAARFGIDNPQPHRAMGDVLTTMALLVRVLWPHFSGLGSRPHMICGL